MTYQDKELLLARICSGRTLVRFRGRPHFLKKPCPTALYLLEASCARALARARRAGLMAEAEAVALLEAEGRWGKALQKELDGLPRRVEDLKCQLFEAVFRSRERERLRVELALARKRHAALIGQRAAYAHVTAEGAAAGEKARLLAALSLSDLRGRRPFPGLAAARAGPARPLERLAARQLRLRPDESALRELARTEPWRSTWAARGADVFGPAARLSDEQRALVAYSKLYDSVWEHPEAPGDDVVNDDDLLDGWLITQRRKRKSGEAAGPAGDFQEVYLVADTPEDAQKIMDMNGPDGKRSLRSRFRAIEQHGTVDEMDMPDTRRRYQMELAQAEGRR